MRILVVLIFGVLGMGVATEAKPAFEFGARGWPSTGSINYRVTNAHPRYGNPSSTIDWQNLAGLCVEGFFRYDHQRSGLYLKGLAGISEIIRGSMIDQDFYAGQSKYSDTSSRVQTSNGLYAILDLGFGLHTAAGSRFGVFIGGQIWRNKLTAVGMVGLNEFGFPYRGYEGVPVLIYEPRWNWLRLGVDGKIVARRLSLAGEAVWVPRAFIILDDSHLLRIDRPRPSIYVFMGRGFQLESFVSYALTAKNEIGVGVRYWKGDARKKTMVHDVEGGYRLWSRAFSETRLGVLLQLKHAL